MTSINPERKSEIVAQVVGRSRRELGLKGSEGVILEWRPDGTKVYGFTAAAAVRLALRLSLDPDGSDSYGQEQRRIDDE